MDRSIWNFEYGSLRELYSEFRDKGVHIENDVYTKNDAYWEQVSQLVKKNGLFSSKKQFYLRLFSLFSFKIKRDMVLYKTSKEDYVWEGEEVVVILIGEIS